MAKKAIPTPTQPMDNTTSLVVEPNKIHHFSPQEIASMGKAAREKMPRSRQAAWDAPVDRPDPVALLEEQGKNRLADLLPIRYGRMLASPFAFYRGAAAIMASDLAHIPNSGLQVQLCGDAHLANFGGFASPERDLVFDINDFDETLPGPWEWDVKRLVTSFEIAGRERGFKQKERQAAVLGVLAEYRQAMAEFAAMRNLEVWYALLDETRIVSRWGAEAKQKTLKVFAKDFAHAHTRDNARASEKLTQRRDGMLKIVSTPPLVVPIAELLPQDERQDFDRRLRILVRKFRQSLQGDRRHLMEKYELVDIARKVVGVGSVGLRTWIVLFVGKDEGDTLFLQCKESQASVLEPYLGKSLYADQGRRVVEGQRLMQSASDIFLGWDRASDTLDHIPRDFYIRQLMDWKLSIDIESMTPNQLNLYGKMCGWTLARAHARSGNSIAITAYLGNGKQFDLALAEFAVAYAVQNERDYQALVEAVKNGRIKAETGI